MSGDMPWTAGPWEIDWDSEDFPIILGHPVWPAKRYGVDGEWEVARLDDMLGEKPAEMKANARLIAAAPEMAEALQDALLFVDLVALWAKREGDAGQQAEAEQSASCIRAILAKIKAPNP